MRDERSEIIKRIIATIQRVKKMDLVLDREKLADEIQSEYLCQRRTAQDYIDTAIRKLNNLGGYLDGD